MKKITFWPRVPLCIIAALAVIYVGTILVAASWLFYLDIIKVYL